MRAGRDPPGISILNSMRSFLPVIIAALASSLQAQPADLVLRNGRSSP